MKQKWMILTVAAAALLTACGQDDADNNSAEECAAGLTLDPIQGECVRLSTGNETDPLPRDAGRDSTDATDDAGPVDEPDATTAEDASDMPSSAPDLGCITDEDGDGSYAMSCGGDDCDDTDPRRFPGAAELCDELDNNCDDEVNEGIDCSLYAHSDNNLYEIDFFAGDVVDLGPTVANLWDIDTSPDGMIYGIANNYLYVYDPLTGEWTSKPQPLSSGFFDATPNGFCIDNDDNAYLTAGGTLRRVDLNDGTSTVVGSMAPALSSGDCVVNKGNVLFMTSRHTTPDSFARIDGDTGVATIVGQTSHDGIWGLTAAYNRVFGMTDAGEVVEIDVTTGQTTLIHTYQGLSFFGSASTPDR